LRTGIDGGGAGRRSVERGFGVLESGVREAVTEGEQRVVAFIDVARDEVLLVLACFDRPAGVEVVVVKR
jgi:hypothetical protein